MEGAAHCIAAVDVNGGADNMIIQESKDDGLEQEID
jgi:hypothetical protein